uniref:CHORD domain-containing protein n=1 Tax=Chrysotila carterae TaxID=13221 RepID=A0A7S4B2U6_CHRCT
MCQEAYAVCAASSYFFNCIILDILKWTTVRCFKQVKDSSPFTHTSHKLLRSTDTPERSFEDKAEVRVVPKPVATASQDKTPRCKNYGCQCEFDESSNHEAACRHHKSPPVFHDTRKWWSCCEGTKVYSFDELFQIPGCQVGAHSLQPPPQEVERKAAISEATSKALKMHEEAEKPVQGRAPPPTQVFKPSEPPEKKQPNRPPLPVGRARCRHYGCQNEYATADNGESACRYHAQAPVFHEGTKSWPCCNVKKWDFDEFLAVPGCCTGPHEPSD